MSKSKIIEELTNLLVVALRHKIGSIVNENEIYAQKYAKDVEVLFEQAKKSIAGKDFNIYERKEILNKLKIKLTKELESGAFLNKRKFDILDKEINDILKEVDLDENNP